MGQLAQNSAGSVTGDWNPSEPRLVFKIPLTFHELLIKNGIPLYSMTFIPSI